ncbi:MAG: hypothetical protein AAF458_13990 [Pseudomonadota bacterium]
MGNSVPAPRLSASVPIRAMIHALRARLILLLAAWVLIPAANAASFQSPGILMLGDSQITFGSGPVLLRFLEQLKQSCAAHVPDDPGREAIKALGAMSVGIIGVRSTSLHSWTARRGRSKRALCDVDPKWRVNAGTYGVINRSGRRYVQMGQGAEHQVCRAGQSGFEALLRPDYYAPALLILSFLGNAADRWAKHPNLAVRDVERTIAHLPDSLPCVFMTSAPAHLAKENRLRLRAQRNIQAAFEATGNRCSFVPGFTKRTISTNEASPHFFRRKASGAVKDPYHPVGKGPRAFLDARAPALCLAIAAETRGRTLAAPPVAAKLVMPRPRPRPASLLARVAAARLASLPPKPWPRPRAKPARRLRPGQVLPPRPWPRPRARPALLGIPFDEVEPD